MSKSLRTKKEYVEFLWIQGFNHAKEYYLKHGDLECKKNYVTKDGFSLWRWLCRQRDLWRKGLLNKKQIEMMNSINFIWDKYENEWLIQYNLLKNFLKESGKPLYPLSKLPIINGYDLFHWITTQTSKFHKTKEINASHKKLLQELGVRFEKKKSDWDDMYNIAKQYYFDNCLKKGSKKLIISNEPEYKKLKIWIRHQRANYRNRNNTLFTEDRILKLEKIGMVWNEKDSQWFEMFEIAKDYSVKKGDLDVTIDVDHTLFTWVRTQRKAFKAGKMSYERIEMLNSIKMIWDASKKIIFSSFPEKTIYFYLKKKYENIISNDREYMGGKEFDIYIPELTCAIEYDGVYYHKDSVNEHIKDDYCEKNGVKLIRIREKGLFTNKDSELIKHISREMFPTMELVLQEVCKILNINYDELDVDLTRDSTKIFSLVNSPKDKFDELYNECLIFYRKYGNLNVPVGYRGTNGKDLHRWLINTRTGYNLKIKVYLNDENVKKLTDLGMVWEPKSSWDRYYPLAKKYYEEHGNLRVLRNYIVDGKNLGNWVKRMRDEYKKNKLSKEQIKSLENIGIEWKILKK